MEFCSEPEALEALEVRAELALREQRGETDTEAAEVDLIRKLRLVADTREDWDTQAAEVALEGTEALLEAENRAAEGESLDQNIMRTS